MSVIEESIIKGYKWIDDYAFSLKSYIRIINDKPIEFPLNHQLAGHNSLIEISHLKWNECPNKGWNQPDKIIGDVEIFYLWKQFKKK